MDLGLISTAAKATTTGIQSIVGIRLKIVILAALIISVVWFVRHYDDLVAKAKELTQTKQQFENYQYDDNRGQLIGLDLIYGNNKYETDVSKIEKPATGTDPVITDGMYGRIVQRNATGKGSR